MPRIPYPESTLYRSLLEESRAVDPEWESTCSAIALSVTTGLGYNTCRDALVAVGADLSRGAFRHQVLRAAKDLGFRHHELDMADIIGRYPPTKQYKTNVTPKQVTRFRQAWQGLPPVLLWTKDHVCGVVDAEVHDWARSSSQRVFHVTAILPSWADSFKLPWGAILDPMVVAVNKKGIKYVD